MQRKSHKRPQKRCGKFPGITGNTVLICRHIFHGSGGGLRDPPHQQAEHHPAATRKKRHRSHHQQVTHPAFPCRFVRCCLPVAPPPAPHTVTLIQRQEKQAEQRPHKPDGFDQYQHPQVKGQPAIIEQRRPARLLSFVRHGKQEPAVDACHGQIRTESVIAVHLRNARKKPQRRRHEKHDDHISALQSTQQRQQKDQIHHIITGKSQALAKGMRIKMQKPPFDQLCSRRVVPEFRRHIPIFLRKTVQIIQRSHICRPEIDIIPPGYHLARHTHRHHKQQDGGRHKRWICDFLQTQPADRSPLLLLSAHDPDDGQHDRHPRDPVDPGQMTQHCQTIQHKHKHAHKHRHRFHQSHLEISRQPEDTSQHKTDM